MRFLIKFSYDGSNYSGYQAQKNLRSIQGEMEKAISIVNNHQKTAIVASGRTDKGVHALFQCAHADLSIDITEKKLKRALNSNLPADIHVIETLIVDEKFHARYNVKEKKYKYIINTGEYNPLERNHVFQYNYVLDINKIEESLKYFVGKKDFRAFVTDNKEKLNCIRTIKEAKLEIKDKKIEITFIGDGFLRYQVRNMVGLLIKIGEGKLKPEDIPRIIESKDRTKAGKTAPAQGLYLVEVKY